MKTYFEKVKGASEPFNWRHYLTKGIEGNLSVSEKVLLSKLAGEWVTCACGNQCDIIPRMELGMPEDYKLRVLGYLFSGYVDSQEYEEAAKILEQIEQRSMQLIEELSYAQWKESASNVQGI